MDGCKFGEPTTGEANLIIRDVVNAAIDELVIAGVDEARQDAWILLGHVCGRDRATLLADALVDLSPTARSQYRAFVKRRVAREPLAQIIGRKEFWSLDFQVDANVLCPRPDSECLIETTLDLLTRRDHIRDCACRILDMGTGSGCLLLALLSEWRTAVGFGVDISCSALCSASANGKSLDLAERVNWMCGDWGRALDGHFDVIVSNPPYIAAGEAGNLAQEIRQFEPEAALFAGEDGLDAYRAMADDLRRLLAPEGFACLEIGFGQANAVAAVMVDAGLRPIGSRQDLAGIDRCLAFERC